METIGMDYKELLVLAVKFPVKSSALAIIADGEARNFQKRKRMRTTQNVYFERPTLYPIYIRSLVLSEIF